MSNEEHIGLLLYRLWAACSRFPDYGGDLWGRGLEVIQRKYGVEVRLSKVESVRMVLQDPTSYRSVPTAR